MLRAQRAKIFMLLLKRAAREFSMVSDFKHLPFLKRAARENFEFLVVDHFCIFIAVAAREISNAYYLWFHNFARAARESFVVYR